jgi:hypothetical protein
MAREMTTEQRQAVDRLVASLVDSTWVRPPRNPATGIRPRGPSVELADGSYVFALCSRGGRINWWVCDRRYGRQLYRGSVDPLTWARRRGPLQPAA